MKNKPKEKIIIKQSNQVLKRYDYSTVKDKVELNEKIEQYFRSLGELGGDELANKVDRFLSEILKEKVAGANDVLFLYAHGAASNGEVVPAMAVVKHMEPSYEKIQACFDVFDNAKDPKIQDDALRQAEASISGVREVDRESISDGLEKRQATLLGR